MTVDNDCTITAPNISYGSASAISSFATITPDDQPPDGDGSSNAMTSSITPVRLTTRTCWPRCRGEQL
jgi:spore coat protein U-like protein